MWTPPPPPKDVPLEDRLRKLANTTVPGDPLHTSTPLANTPPSTQQTQTIVQQASTSGAGNHYYELHTECTLLSGHTWLPTYNYAITNIITAINEVTLCCPPLSAICIQETWLNEHDDISIFNLNGYNCISQGKTCSQRGGLVIFLNDNFNYNIKKCPEISTLWVCQVIETTSNMLSRKVILGNVYRLPRETSTDHMYFPPY